MIDRARWLTAASAFLALTGAGHAADQTVRGAQVQVRDASPGFPASRRRLVLEGREVGSPNTITGDPTIAGAALTVSLGAQEETYLLQQNLDPRSGKPYWRRRGGGFTYANPSGTNGAAISLGIERSPTGRFRIKAVVANVQGAVGLRPPDPGTEACVRLDLVGGDSYHMLFPPPPASRIARNDARAFVIKRPLTEGLCAAAPTTTSSTTTTSTSTTTTTLPCDGAEPHPACPALLPREVLAVAGRDVWLEGARLDASPETAGALLVVFSCPDGDTSVARADAEVTEWSESRIRLALPAGVDSRCTVRVVVGPGATADVSLRVYAATTFPLPGRPIVLDRSADGGVWIGAEFSAALFHLPPGAAAIETLEIPTPTGFFRNMLRFNPEQPQPDAGVEFSAFVERVVAGPDGSVWLSQGGWPFYRHDTGAPHPNGSRLVRYAPTTREWRCYNAPLQSAEIVGFSLLADETIVVAAAGEDVLLRMSPAALDASGWNDCSSAQGAGVCGEGETAVSDTCWERHQLPGDAWHYPTHVHEDPATGDWWTVGALSDQALRYTPSTRAWAQWSLPATTRQPQWMWPYNGAQPWWFALGADGRVRAAAFITAALDELDPATGVWRQRQAPTAFPTDWSFVYWHATDDSGRLWVSGAFGLPGDLPARALGYWPADEDAGVFLPPLDDDPPTPLNGITGFWISPDARTVYGARYSAQEIVRLEQVP